MAGALQHPLEETGFRPTQAGSPSFFRGPALGPRLTRRLYCGSPRDGWRREVPSRDRKPYRISAGRRAPWTVGAWEAGGKFCGPMVYAVSDPGDKCRGRNGTAPTRLEQLSDESARVPARCPNLRPEDLLTIAKTISYEVQGRAVSRP